MQQLVLSIKNPIKTMERELWKMLSTIPDFFSVISFHNTSESEKKVVLQSTIKDCKFKEFELLVKAEESINGVYRMGVKIKIYFPDHFKKHPNLYFTNNYRGWYYVKDLSFNGSNLKWEHPNSLGKEAVNSLIEALSDSLK